MNGRDSAAAPDSGARTSADRWRSALQPADATLQQVIQNLVDTGLQIVLVKSDDGFLLGTVTDGDIRRGLLRGLNLSSSIEGIMNREALVVPPQLSSEMVLRLMQTNGIRQLPVVDEDRRVIGLHLWESLRVPLLRTNVMVIMAGGEGTRLRPQTEKCPKPMLPVAGRPMLEHIIERARADGFSHFVFAVCYLGHVIEEHFGDGSAWQVKIEYLREDRPLGTAGAISLLDPRPEAPIVVSNGDVLTDVDYGELLDFHCRHGAAATMAVRLHEWQHPFGVVRTNGVDIVEIDEKPIARSHINAGLYVLAPESLDALSSGEHCDMTTLFGRLKERNARTIVYPMHEPWLDVGGPADYRHASDSDQAARTTTRKRPRQT